MRKKTLQQIALALTGAFFWNLPAGACAELSIEQAVDMALQQNTSLKITQKGENTAEAELRKAKGSRGFTVSATGGVNTKKINNEQRTDTGSADLSAKLPIYTGGKNEAAVESGEIGLKSAVLSTDRERENVRLNVIKAYYDVLEAKRTVAVDQESVNNYEAHLNNVEQLYSAGSKARIDVLRSSVELSDARQTLIKAQNTYEVNQATLRNILNIDRNEPLTLTDDFAYVPFHSDMNSCITYAYAHRKDLQVDQYTLEQKKLAVTQAKAGFLPTLSLSLGTGLSDQLNAGGDNTHSYTAGLSASWNVFDSGVTRAAVDEAKTAQEVAALTLQKDQENVDLAVRQAYYNMREAEKRFISTHDAVGKAQEDYFIAREKYRAGEGLMLDIIDAQVALSKAQLNFISAQYDYARYKATIENNVGLGITESAEQLPVAEDSAPVLPIDGMGANDAASEAAQNGVTR